MSFQRAFVMILTVAAWAGTSAMAQTAILPPTTTTTTVTVTQETSYPPIGLAISEKAQINVANLASNSSRGTAASCTGTIAFLNSSGATIGSATPFTVTSGQIFSVSLPFSKTGASGRTEIRGVIGYSTTSGVPCTLSSSLETYDSTSGVTHLFLSNDTTPAVIAATAGDSAPGQ